METICEASCLVVSNKAALLCVRSHASCMQLAIQDVRNAPGSCHYSTATKWMSFDGWSGSLSFNQRMACVIFLSLSYIFRRLIMKEWLLSCRPGWSVHYCHIKYQTRKIASFGYYQHKRMKSWVNIPAKFDCQSRCLAGLPPADRHSLPFGPAWLVGTWFRSQKSILKPVGKSHVCLRYTIHVSCYHWCRLWGMFLISREERPLWKCLSRISGMSAGGSVKESLTVCGIIIRPSMF